MWPASGEGTVFPGAPLKSVRALTGMLSFVLTYGSLPSKRERLAWRPDPSPFDRLSSRRRLQRLGPIQGDGRTFGVHRARHRVGRWPELIQEEVRERPPQPGEEGNDASSRDPRHPPRRHRPSPRRSTVATATAWSMQSECHREGSRDDYEPDTGSACRAVALCSRLLAGRALGRKPGPATVDVHGFLRRAE